VKELLIIAQATVCKDCNVFLIRYHPTGDPILYSESQVKTRRTRRTSSSLFVV